MVSHIIGRIRGGSAKGQPSTTPSSLPHPNTMINSPVSRTKTPSHRSSTCDFIPPTKPSSLDQVLKLIHPRTSRLSRTKLKIAPSGAIVFTPVESQESLGSSILPAETPGVPPTNLSTARPYSTLVEDQHMPRLSSFESVRSSQSSIPRVRTTEYERQRRYNFLGRHPAPVQRRSTSLPRILENQPPAQSPPRQPLFFGGPTNRPRPGYIKIPRFVPLEIRLNPSAEMIASSSSALCDHAHDYEGRRIVHCNHCGQRFSLDSSRSTRGGSEVPNFKTDLLNKSGALSGSKAVIQVVENKFKAVFGKGKENAGHESEDPAS